VSAPTPTLIGREQELSRLRELLEAVGPGGQAVVVEGEAGIGKSTLWFHAVAVARTRADRVLAWRASVAERDLAFATLTALLDEPAAEAAIDRLSGPRRAAISAAMGRGAAFGAHSDPSLVGLAVADVLRDLGRDRPLVVAIDDIQWADRASEDALAFAARRLRSEPVAVVLARRTGPAQADRDEASSGGHTPSGRPPARDLSATFAPIASLDTAIEHRTRIVVGPLSVGALGRLIHERLDVAHPRPLLTRLHEACSGNPFLGLEISRSLKGRGLEPAPGEPFPVPPEAGPLVRDHLATLSRDARRAVVIVARPATGPSTRPSRAASSPSTGRGSSRPIRCSARRPTRMHHRGSVEPCGARSPPPPTTRSSGPSTSRRPSSDPMRASPPPSPTRHGSPVGVARQASPRTFWNVPRA